MDTKAEVKLDTYIYVSQYIKDAPEIVKIMERWNQAKAQFNDVAETFRAELKFAEQQFVEKRNEQRKTLQYDYTIVTSTDKYGDKLYTITRKTLNPIAGDEDYCKDIVYCSIKVVNNVMISLHSGYAIGYDGLLLSDDDVAMLEAGKVPQILLTTKPLF